MAGAMCVRWQPVPSLAFVASGVPVGWRQRNAGPALTGGC